MTVESPERARFHGCLDTTALGGAGFASQHSAGTPAWDLADYEGLVVSVGAGDGRRYALTLKDELPPRRPDGREPAAVSWEAAWVADGPAAVRLRWSDFGATYRGRPAPDAPPLRLADVKRVGLMMRR